MTDPSLQCPACAASDVARGRLSEGLHGTFRPDGLRFWTTTAPTLPLFDRSDPGAPSMSPVAHACTACGLVWTYVDPERLRTVLREAGSDATRGRFAAGDGEPPS